MGDDYHNFYMIYLLPVWTVQDRCFFPFHRVACRPPPSCSLLRSASRCCRTHRVDDSDRLTFLLRNRRPDSSSTVIHPSIHRPSVCLSLRPLLFITLSLPSHLRETGWGRVRSGGRRCRLRNSRSVLWLERPVDLYDPIATRGTQAPV